MSWEEQLYLPRPIDTYDAAEIRQRVEALLAAAFDIEVQEAQGTLSVRVKFSRDQVDDIARALGATPGRWLDYDWRASLDPPRDPERGYEIMVDFVDDELPLLRVYSNIADNRQAWPFAFALMACLGEAYGASEDPPEGEPDDDDAPGIDELN